MSTGKADMKPVNLTAEEAAIVAITRINKQESKLEVRKEWRIGRLRVVYNWRSKKNLWGRFGGGWNWNLGFQASSRTVIVNLLVASLRFNMEAPK